MHSRLKEFLTKHKTLYYKKLGFRKKFSTGHVFINLNENKIPRHGLQMSFLILSEFEHIT